MPGKIIIKKSKNDEFFASIKGGNNRTIFNTETYKQPQGVRNAVQKVKNMMPGVKVIDSTKKKS